MNDIERSSLIGKGANLSGENCPRCNYRTHKAVFDGEVWYRCLTDHCPRAWYEGDA